MKEGEVHWTSELGTLFFVKVSWRVARWSREQRPKNSETEDQNREVKRSCANSHALE